MMSNTTPGYRLVLLVFIILAAVAPAPGGPGSGRSYWDAIFELGYIAETGKTSDVSACRRIETAYEFSRLISGHRESDRELAEAYRGMRQRIKQKRGWR